MIRIPRSPALLLFPLVLAACGDGAETETEITPATVAEETPERQALIQLPADFGPEGIAITGDTFYVGSLAQGTAGQILAGSLTTGETRQVVAPTGVTALGLKHDPRTNYLFVAGGGTGTGHAYDAATGAEVGSWEFTTTRGQTINDVELTDNAAFFTNSQAPELYRVALGTGGQPGEMTTLPLPDNFGTGGQCEGVPPIMGNGIAATPGGEYLILIHMSEGQLYRLETGTGEVQPITLTGGDLCSADGLVLDGQTLYAVQNRLNQVAVVEMGPDFLTGTVQRTITEPFASNDAIAIPTVAADAGDALYAVTAGFADPSPDYVVRIEK